MIVTVRRFEMLCFPSPICEPVRRHNSEQQFSLVRADSLVANERTLQQLVAVCNEPEIYRWLFADLCGGKPYSPKDADAWLYWAYRGWSENTHFAFAVLDQWGDVLAACDIKSNSVIDAEIGYWCSTAASGIMTDAVRAMIDVALRAGFRSFIAYTRPGNVRSVAVLGRLGFARPTVAGDDGRFRHRYCPRSSTVTHL